MKSENKIIDAIKVLAMQYPIDQISYADIAREANVHWTTVKRHVGNKESLKKIISSYQTNHHPTTHDSRTKIIESAEQVFAIYGFEGATLDQIAENAGLTKGAVYWHFSNKSELLLTLIDRSLKKLATRIVKQDEPLFQSSSPLDSLQMLFNQEFQACSNGINHQTLLFFEFISKRRDKEISEKLGNSFAHLFEETSKIIQQYQQQKHLSNTISPDKLSIILHALMNGIILMAIVSPENVPLDTIGTDVSKLVWQGIAPNN